jgi:hypothetical protein
VPRAPTTPLSLALGAALALAPAGCGRPGVELSLENTGPADAVGLQLVRPAGSSELPPLKAGAHVQIRSDVCVGCRLDLCYRDEDGALRSEPVFVPDVLERGQVVIHAEGPSRVVVRFHRLKTLF